MGEDSRVKMEVFGQKAAMNEEVLKEARERLSAMDESMRAVREDCTNLEKRAQGEEAHSVAQSVSEAVATNRAKATGHVTEQAKNIKVSERLGRKLLKELDQEMASLRDKHIKLVLEQNSLLSKDGEVETYRRSCILGEMDEVQQRMKDCEANKKEILGCLDDSDLFWQRLTELPELSKIVEVDLQKELEKDAETLASTSYEIFPLFDKPTHLANLLGYAAGTENPDAAYSMALALAAAPASTPEEIADAEKIVKRKLAQIKEKVDAEMKKSTVEKEAIEKLWEEKKEFEEELRRLRQMAPRI